MNNKVILSSLAGFAVVAGGIGYGVTLIPNAEAVECNAGVIESCESLIDSTEFVSGSEDLDEKGNKLVETIIADRLDTSLRAGENLKTDYSRIINSKDQISDDIKFTSVSSIGYNAVVTDVRWIDGVKVTYTFNRDGSGFYNQVGMDFSENRTINWEISGNNIKVTNAKGSVTYLGGVATKVVSKMEESISSTARREAANDARIAQERADQIRREEAGERIIRGIFNPFVF